MLVLLMCMLIGPDVSCTASCVYSDVYITGIVQEVVSSKDNTNDFLFCVFVKSHVCVPDMNSQPDTATQCNISLSCRYCLPLLHTARRHTLFANHAANKCMQDHYTH